MATIRQENVIISVTTESEKARKELRKVRDEVVGIGASVAVTNDELKEAFTDDLVDNYIGLLQSVGGEFEDLEELARGLREGIDESLSGLSTGQAIEALQQLNQIILDAENAGSDFSKSFSSALQQLNSEIPKTIDQVDPVTPGETSSNVITPTPIEVPITPVIQPTDFNAQLDLLLEDINEQIDNSVEQILSEEIPIDIVPEIVVDPEQLKADLARKYAEIIQEVGGEFEDLEELTGGIIEGINESLRGLDPEQTVDALNKLDQVFENAGDSSGDFVDELITGLGDLRNELLKFSPEESQIIQEDSLKRVNTLLEESGDTVKKLGFNLEEIKDKLEGTNPPLFTINEELDKVEKAVAKANRRAKIQQTIFSGIRKTVNGVRSGFDNLTTRIASGLQGGVAVIGRFIGRVGSLAAALGIADLISGWSTFSKQFQATLRTVPGFSSGIDNLTQKFRVLGELFSRTLGPLIERFVNFITTGLQNTNLGVFERAFQAIGVLLTNIGNGFARFFSPGGEADQGFDNFVNGFTSAIAIANGIWEAFLAVLSSIKPFFLDLGSTITGVLGSIASAIPGSQGLGAVLVGQSVRLGDQAKEARKDMENFVVAYKRGVKEIEAIPISDIKWEDITPTPTEEEKDAIIKRFIDLRKGLDDLVQDWLKQLNSLQEEFPIGGSNNITNLVQDVNERFFALTRTLDRLKSGEAADGLFDSAIKELNDLREQGKITASDFDNQIAIITQLQEEEIISESQVQSAIALLDQLRTRALEPLVDELNEFANLDPLVLQTGLDADLRPDNRPGNIADGVGVVGQGGGADPFVTPEQEDRLAGIANILSETGTAVNVVFDGINQGIDRMIDRINSLADAQASRVKQAARLAEQGNAEILQSEIQRLDEIETAREQALARQRKIAAVQVALNNAIAVAQAVVAVTRAAAEGSIFGAIAGAIALAASIAASIIAVNSAFSNLGAFKEGIPYLEGQGTGTSDSNIVRVSKGERIVDEQRNKRIGGKNLSNKEMEELINKGRQMVDIVEGRRNPPLELMTAIGSISSDNISPPGISVPPPQFRDDIGIQIVDGLGDIEDVLNKKLENVTEELIRNRKALEKIKVEFSVSPEGLEASVRTVTSYRDRKRRLTR